MATVTFDHVYKRYGDFAAVNDFNLEIQDGEFMVLVGPSGCGKTTSLRMIAGLEEITEGTLRIGDRVVNDVPPKDRDIAMVFQSYALYPHMTVYENISFPLRLQGRPVEERRRRAREAATQVQIGDLLDRRPAQLSGGQQKRVALARALVKQPTLLLLDEPLSNLDAKLRVLMRAEIKRLQRTLGITTILVTHDQIEAMTMADRIAVLKDGLLQQIGTPDDLYYRPATVFVAGFIGTPPMSFLTVSVERADGRTVLAGEAMRLTATPRVAERLGERTALMVGIRPEDIRVSLVPSEGTIKGRVLDIEPMGREFVVAATVGQEVVVALVGHGFTARHDQAVWLDVPPDRLYPFDPTTGAALP